MPKGYRLPENLNPADNCYIIVSVPNEDRYRQAFFGAYEWLGYWFAWERDTQRRGKDAASRWRTSVLETLELYEEIGCMSPLTINVNCDGGSQCCTFPTVNVDVTVTIGQAAYDEIVALPGTSIDNGTDAPPGYATYQDYLDAKCAYANKYALDLRDSWEALSNLGLAAATLSIAEMIAIVSMAGRTSWAVGLIGAGITATGVGSALIAGLVFLGTGVGAAAYAYFKSVLEEWSHEEIVCAVYGAENATDARTRLIDVMGSWAVDAGIAQSAIGGKFINWLVQWLNTLLTERSLFAAFDATNYITTLPASNCLTCSGVIPDTGGASTLANGLLHYWEWETLAGTDSHGTYNLDRTGNFGNIAGITGLSIYNLDGGDNRFNLQFAPDMCDGGSWSFGGWVYLAGYPTTSIAGLMSLGVWGVLGKLRMYVNNGTVKSFGVQVRNPSETLFGVVTAEAIPLNQWAFLYSTYNHLTNQLTARINDGLIAVTSVTGGQMSSNQQLCIRRYMSSANTPAGNPLNGRIDEWAWWNRVLDQDEWEVLYNIGQGWSYQGILNPGGPA